MLSKDIAWARSGPGKFLMQYPPGKTSCCRQTEKKFCEAHKYLKGKRERESERETITKSEVWSWEHPMHRQAVLYRPMATRATASSQALNAQSEQRISFNCKRAIGTSKNSAGDRKSIVINRYVPYQCQHNYFYQTIESIFLILELYTSTWISSALGS